MKKEQLKYLLCLPNIETRYGLRDATYITLLYDSGCRNQEILNLTIKDIEFVDEVSNISVTGKGNKYRKVPISKKASALLKKHIKRFHIEDKQYLFYTERSGIITKMSDDNGARIFNKYEKLSIEQECL